MTDHWFPVWCQCRIFVVVQRKLCAELSSFSSKNVLGQWDWPVFSVTDSVSVQEGHVKYVSFPYIEFTFSLSPLLQINLLWWIWIRDQRPKHVIIQLLCGGGVLGKR